MVQCVKGKSDGVQAEEQNCHRKTMHVREKRKQQEKKERGQARESYGKAVGLCV